MPRIQIWSNVDGSEFAIRLNTDFDSFRALTKQEGEEQYVRIVEETEYLYDMEYDWDYALKSWMERHNGRSKNGIMETKRNGATINSKMNMNSPPVYDTANKTDEYSTMSAFSESSKGNDTDRKNKFLPDKFTSASGLELSSDNGKKSSSSRSKRRSGWLKSKFKCHYCGLLFVNERKRGTHEKEWHWNKIRRRDNLS